MSLFVVNRYLGEEENGSISKESRSQALLAKLQQKAKEKQRQSLTEETQKPDKERMQKDVKKKRKADKDSSISVKSLPDTPVTGTAGLEETGGGEEKTETENIAPEQTAEKTPAPTGFTVLGGFDNKPVQKVHRVLPQWLAQPDVIHRDIKGNLVNISEIHGLSALLVKKLQNNGIQNFFPVQAEVIPAVLESAQQGLLIGRGGYKPRDICVSAPTGSGKTLAFVIPVIQVLMERVVCEVRALAVLPTKELAQQVCKVFASYAEGTSLKVVMLAGQKSFAAEQSCLSELSLSPPQMPLQKLLFSATLTQNPEKLQQLGLHQPRLFSSIHSQSSTISTPGSTADPPHTQGCFNFPEGLTEYYVPCTLSKKPLLILHFILRMKLSPILCFTNSREAAHRLFLLVQLFGGVQAAEFSSRLSPAERKKALKEFEQGKIQLIGRTARAGKTGLAFTFLLGVQEKNFLQMVVEAGTPGIQKQIVKPESLKGMEARYEQTLQELANVIKDEKTR
ncbi:hypothetical protein JOQ06_004654 [Pogonophryne albipinna]|uniref:ATP-dependent RNA helicase n=1 Tax=Pogonophryne albipinna TaxID=1090488 RepID=A0AAD6AQN6_9TELE|nr:hypothetical protein JOQ06_004654 [Pogonophryne albipinna]